MANDRKRITSRINFDDKENKKKCSSHLTSEDNPAFRVIILGVDPSVSREENGVTAITDDNLRQANLRGEEVGDKNGTWFTKVSRYGEGGCELEVSRIVPSLGES